MAIAARPRAETRRGRLLVLILIAIGALAAAGAVVFRIRSREPDAPPTYFAQAQSFLEELDGAPLVAANWHGHFRPYVLRDGEYRPLLTPHVDRELARVDLYSPTPVTPRQIVMAGQTAGKSNFDLYRWDVDAQALQNLTDSPDVDDGDLCVERSAGLLSFRSGTRTQRFFRAGADGVSILAEPLGLALDRCLWTSPEQLVGVRGRQPPYQLVTCAVTPPRVTCTPSPALADVDHFIDFFVTADRRLGVVARRRGTQFRRAYLVGATGLEEVPGLPLGDVLEYDGTHARMGLHGTYWSTAETARDDALTLFKLERIGDRYTAIAADAHTNKTVAELRDGRWQLVVPPDVGRADTAAEPFAVWLRARSGALHQAIYVGPLAPTQVVLWLHGGPRENVSPRFNPYFHWLNQQGFGVLALNYPGSTGRGAAYEQQFGPDGIADALQAALDYLWSQHVEKVVSWSISTGHNLQFELLAHRFGISALVDQAGRDPRKLRAQAERQHVPYLSILGVNDEGGGDPSVDVSYPGGHDITFEPDFRMMLARVAPFLRDAPPWRYRAAPPLDAALVLDPAHAGNPRDPNRHRDLTEAALTFELAHTLMNGCLKGRPVILTRTGQPTLESRPGTSVQRRVAFSDVIPAAKLLSLHFNASSRTGKSENLTSAFVPIPHQQAETELAAALVTAMRGAGIGPKLTYPELAKVPLESLLPGVFARDLALLRRSAHVRSHARIPPPRVVFEVAYYDDDAESRRLAERSLAADGTWVRPRITEIADAICPAVLRFLADAPPPSP